MTFSVKRTLKCILSSLNLSGKSTSLKYNIFPKVQLYKSYLIVKRFGLLDKCEMQIYNKLSPYKQNVTSISSKIERADEI